MDVACRVKSAILDYEVAARSKEPEFLMTL